MEMTGIDTRKPDNSWLTAISMNLRTGSEPVNASTHGNAEVLDNAKDKAGATVMMHAKKYTSDYTEARILFLAFTSGKII